MITLYKELETVFTHNGIGVLKDCINCTLHRELNGLFSLELEYPIHSKMANKIEKFMIIKVPTPNGNQLFRIQERERNLGVLRVFATHIFFDLIKNFIADTNIVGKTRIQAINQLLSKTMNLHKFTVEGDEGTKQNNCRVVRKNPIEAMIGDADNTIRSRWGLELDHDNYKIIAKERIGEETGVLIAYRKNMLGINETLDMKEVATRIVPQGYNGLMLPEYYIDSPNIGSNYQPLIAHVKFENIKVKESPEDEEGFDTKEEAWEEMRRQTKLLFTDSKIDIPFFNYEVEFEELGKTEEYNQFKNLEKVNLGDTVIVRHGELNLDLKGRIIAYEYNCLTEKYIRIELGMKKKDLTMQIQQAVAEINVTKDKIEMEVSNLSNTMSSKLTITEKKIMTEVNDVENNLGSKIEQNTDSIRSKVSKNNIISEINQSAEEIQIQAEKVNLVGLVTFTNLLEEGQVKINGGNITAGEITSVDIRGVNIYGSDFIAGNIESANFSCRGEGWFYQSLTVDPNLQVKRHIGCEGDLNVVGNTRMMGDFDVKGKKNCIQNTSSYGWRRLGAYETAEIYFGDLGFGQLINRECRIDIDPIFAETINLNSYYHVFLSKYGKGDIWVEEIGQNYFIIKGENDIRFSWELKAKRRGFENNRLEEVKFTDAEIIKEEHVELKNYIERDVKHEEF